MADQQQAPGLLANILAVAGFIILILIIVWGAYNLLRLTGSSISNLFPSFGGSGDVAVVAPSSPVQSGRAFPLSWQHEAEEEGTYAILYQCRAGFRFDAVTPAGNTMALPCGNAYGVGNAMSLSLTPVLSGTSSPLEMPLTIVFMPSATSSTERPQGTATVTVVAESSATVVAPVPSSPQTSAEPESGVASGDSDLSVRILAVGVIDAASGVFVQRAPTSPNDIAAVQFDIKNDGAAASGAYRFSVQLPTQPVYPYISAPQTSLAPGAHVVSTLRFGPVAPGGGTIAIEVDAARATKDSNRSNNSATIWMNASVSSYYYQYQVPFVY